MGHYTLENVRRLLTNPDLLPKAAFVLRRDLYEKALDVNRRWYQATYEWDADEFVDAEWDNLLILDAARPDVLFECDFLPDAEKGTRVSPGSYSLQFMESQFFGRDLRDAVYVTANPHVDDLPDGVFHDVVNLLVDGWDPDLDTVPPDAVVEATLDAFERYPNKRLVVHFMQPHYPFVGPHGREVTAGLNRSDDDALSTHPWFDQMWGDRNDPRPFGSTNDTETVLRAYRENHEVVASHVESLLEDLPGRSVVTADHANLVGERGFPIPFRLYGHPQNFPHPNLVTVPWMRVEGERRDVERAAPVERDRLDESVVADRLASLGYAESGSESAAKQGR